MALAGILDLFRGKPQGAVSDGGKMSLADHFRELRARLLRSVLAVVVAIVIAFFFYDQLIELIKGPFDEAQSMLPEGTESRIITSGVGAGLMLQLKLCGVAGLIAACPVWLYQIWAFVLPGLHRRERRWTAVFVVVAGPLFLGGVALGYYVMPKALQVLISFTPDGVENLNDFDHFFAFTIRTLLVFGVAFEIPLFVVLLNLAGVVAGATLARHRAWIIIAIFVFAAVATPSTDPFSMLFLAVPMLGLYLIAEVITRILDRRKGRRADLVEAWSDDEASPL